MGRTGTLITIDMVLQQVEQEGHINIIDTINQLRHKRMKMVQTSVRNHILKLKLFIKCLNLTWQSICNLDAFPYLHTIFIISYISGSTFPLVRSHDTFIINCFSHLP